MSDFQKHPLTVDYSLEMEGTGSTTEGTKLPSILRTLATMGALATALLLLMARPTGETTALVEPPSSSSGILMSAPSTISMICSLENIRTIQGTRRCEDLCAVASCCTGDCWNQENSNICMLYHEHCTVLDGISSSGKSHSYLPDNYQTSGWFGAEEAQLRAQPVEQEPCADTKGRKKLKMCVRHCLPATCCYREDHPATCATPNSHQIQCSEYSECDVLYGKH